MAKVNSYRHNSFFIIACMFFFSTALRAQVLRLPNGG
jgi:hypothetical protein